MKLNSRLAPGCLIQYRHRNSIPVTPSGGEALNLQNGRNRLRRRMAKLGAFFAARILALSLMLILTGSTHSARTLAQNECQDINELMTFDYRSWGIGIHRKCSWYDPICLALQAKQISLGRPVEAWILVSREAAISAGVSPIPVDIRNRLARLFPASLLDRVRFKTGSGFLGTLQWFRSEMEGKGAITLKDVIVFANASDAMGNLRLWAHELEHVRQ